MALAGRSGVSNGSNTGSVSDEGISDRVKRFIATYISSIAQLEILLLLHTNARQTWSAADIARELRIETAGAETQLAALAASGLVVRVAEGDAAPARPGSGAAGNPPAAR